MMHDKAVLFKLVLCLGMLGHQARLMPIASSKLRTSILLCRYVVLLLVICSGAAEFEAMTCLCVHCVWFTNSGLDDVDS